MLSTRSPQRTSYALVRGEGEKRKVHARTLSASFLKERIPGA
jgi:hypothetical protein